MRNLDRLEETLGVEFKDPRLLKEALTHRSYLNENPRWGFPHNERLEYLGDAVLELAVSEHLFEKYPGSDEGRLTGLRAALVNYQRLAEIAREIRLEDHLYLSRGEAKDTGKAREVILANAIEAIFGAVYLDRGYGAARRLVERTVIPHLEEVITRKLYRDPKSVFQELTQEKMKVTPTYRVLSEVGPDHGKVFRVGVFLGERCVAEGKGTSKQEAEAHAAEAALRKLGNGEQE